MYNEWILKSTRTCLIGIVVKLSKIHQSFHQAAIQLLCLAKNGTFNLRLNAHPLTRFNAFDNTAPAAAPSDVLEHLTLHHAQIRRTNLLN